MQLIHTLFAECCAYIPACVSVTSLSSTIKHSLGGNANRTHAVATKASRTNLPSAHEQTERCTPRFGAYDSQACCLGMTAVGYISNAQAIDAGWVNLDRKGEKTRCDRVAAARGQFVNMPVAEAAFTLAGRQETQQNVPLNVDRGFNCKEHASSVSDQSIAHKKATVGETSMLLLSASQELLADSSATSTDSVLAGDIVLLDEPVGHKGSRAVVTKVHETHCTVTVLDSSRRFGVTECCPNFSSLTLENASLRIGSRVVLAGLQGPTTRRMNGWLGTVVAHPREGHPSFIKKQSCPGQPILTVCVHFDEPASAGQASMMIEPRFLKGYDSFV